MRVSVNKDDDGFANHIHGMKVLVNGREAAFCHTADSDLGIAYCYEKGPDGRPFIDPKSRDQIKEIELKGKITILPPEFVV